MIELGLQRISKLLTQTELPWRAIHVAGTNGKGSVCAYISRMLEVYNHSQCRERYNLPSLRHGRFTSPHLVDRWDCIAINGRPVPASLFRGVEDKVHARNRQQDIKSSEFELLTATAFEIFSHEKVDVAVVEVGMGGRLDATNVIGQRDLTPPAGIAIDDFRPPPLVSVITKIGLDHQKFLGDTFKAVAREKAGIIKTGVPVIFDQANEPDVTATFHEIAAQKQTHAVPAGDSAILDEILKTSDSITQDNTQAQRNSPTPITNLSTLPQHTQQNLNLAFRATWTALSRLMSPTQTNPFSTPPSLSNPSTLSLAKSMLISALSTPFPGRQQSLSIASLTGRQEPILLDGAHNAQSAEALSHVVFHLRSSSTPITPYQNYKTDTKKVKWVLAASDTKDATGILRPLLQSGDIVFVVEFGPVDGMPWVKALPCEDLARAARRVLAEKGSVDREEEEEVDVVVVKYGRDVRGALEAACDAAAAAADGGPLVVAGSLYLVGDVLRLLRDVEGSRHI